MRRQNRTHGLVMKKCQISKIQHGGRPPFWKSLVSMQTQMLPQATETWQKFRDSQIQNGEWTPHWKLLFGYNSAACCPIKMKFGVRRQNHTHTKQVRWSKCLKFMKIQNGGRQHFENGYTSVSQPRIIQIWRNMVHKRKFWHSRGNMTNINLKSI